jgi:hypothetical protein
MILFCSGAGSAGNHQKRTLPDGRVQVDQRISLLQVLLLTGMPLQQSGEGLAVAGFAE